MMFPDYRSIMMARFGMNRGPATPQAMPFGGGYPHGPMNMQAPQMFNQAPEGRTPRPMDLGQIVDTSGITPEGRVPRPRDLGGVDDFSPEGRVPRLQYTDKIPGYRF